MFHRQDAHPIALALAVLREIKPAWRNRHWARPASQISAPDEARDA